MRSVLTVAFVACLVLAGCTGAEFEEEPDDEFGGDASMEDGATSGEDASPEGQVEDTPLGKDAADEVRDAPVDEGGAAADAPQDTTSPPASDTTPTTPAPFGDSDRDGIPDTLEQDLASNCTLAGRACADLGLVPPRIGTRDLVLVQVGRSGVEQDWRLKDEVWASVEAELANLSIAVQVADVGIRDDINVSARWNDETNAGTYWAHWVFYDDPASAETSGSSGTQLYDLITLAERADATEERATVLHEVYHALLGDLHASRSRCPDEEVGGPGHSDDPESVLYTSPDCETNEGTVFRLALAEITQLREEPFAALAEMNGPGWYVDP